MEKRNTQEILVTILTLVLGSVYCLFYLSVGFNIWLYLFCFGLIIIFILLYPAVGLYAMVFLTMVFERNFTLSTIILNENTYKFYPLDLLLIVTFLAVVWRADLKSFFNWQKNKLFYLSFLGFSFVFLIAFIRAYLNGNDISDAFSTVKNYLFYSLLFFIVKEIIIDKIQWQRLLQIIYSGAIGIIIIFLINFFGGVGIFTEFIPLSTYGVRYLGGGQAFYLVIAIIFLLHHLSQNNKYQKADLYYWFLLIFSFFGLAFSLLRHLWLGFFVCLIFLFIFYNFQQKKNLLKTLFIAAGIFAGLLGVVYLFNNLAQSNDTTAVDLIYSLKIRLASLLGASGYSDESALWRTEAWKAAAKLLAGSWLFGIGLAQKIYVELFGWESEVLVRDLHNDFIAIALQTGIIGFGFFVWFLVEIIKKAWRLRKSNYALPVIALLLLFLFSANFGTYFDINLLVIFFWLGLGLLESAKTIKI